jgi:ABC-2 type transport system permease protein
MAIERAIADQRRRRPGLAVLAELRFRLAVRRLQSAGGSASAISQLALYLLAIPVAIVLASLLGAGTYRAVRAGSSLYATVSITAIFFGLWQTWTAVSLMLNERGGFDLRRMLVYPLQPARVYALGMLASLVADPFAILWMALLVGIEVGAALARPGPWLVLLAALLAAYAASTVALVALLQELLARIARRRRWREAAVLAAIAGWLGIVLVSAGGVQTLRAVRPAIGVIRWLFHPAAFAAEGARRLLANDPLAAAAWILALLAAAAATTCLAYQLGLALARSGDGDAVADGPHRPAPWPSLLGPLLEKEVLHLTRHPAARIYLVVLPAIAALLGWKLPIQRAGEYAELLSALPLFGLAAYVHLALQMFWANSLGWERGGARVLFLAPVTPDRLLRAKNVALAAYATVVFALAASAYSVMAGPPPAWAAASAALLELGLAPALYGLGNVVSVVLPRAAPIGIQRTGSLSPIAALAGMAITSGTLLAFAVPAMLAVWSDTFWVIPVGFGFVGAGAALAWRVTLPAVGRMLDRRREAVLAEVCGDEA